MLINSSVLSNFHLNQRHSVLTASNTRVIFEYFKMLDVHENNSLNDIQFLCFMKYATSLNEVKIMKCMDLLDTNSTGLIDFETFYPLICVLIAIKDRVEKQFIVQHSKFVFKILDGEGEGFLSASDLTDNG